MRTWARGTLLTASFVALGVSVVPATAFADATSGDAGVLSGNQADISGQVPINVCGNAIATAGDAAAGCSSGSVVANAARGGRKAPHKGRAAAAQGGLTTSGKNGVTSGDQVKAPLSAPAEVCGNAVGNGRAECAGGAAVHGGGGSGTRTTGGDLAVLGGNQVEAPGRAPVSVCGNATAIAGNAAATCDGPALVAAPRRSG
uniref:chaplin family protein n=1 Tax=Actinomadura roseirufa TaxID=2094049 RepID=UPI001040E32D